MKWTKSDNGMVFIHHGRRYSFAYHMEKDVCKLLVETIAVPPTQSISLVMRVNSIKTAKQIAEALER